MDLVQKRSILIDSLADTLANSHDWMSEDSVTDITDVMIQNHPFLDKALATFVAQRFVSLSIFERVRSNFNHRIFVVDSIREFRSN
jgi:hypothetical protein